METNASAARWLLFAEGDEKPELSEFGVRSSEGQKVRKSQRQRPGNLLQPARVLFFGLLLEVAVAGLLSGRLPLMGAWANAVPVIRDRAVPG